MLPEIMGYRRPDGRFGIRNHIAVIATMDNANPTVRRICSLVRLRAFCPGFGRGEMNEDLALHNLPLHQYRPASQRVRRR
ncbi:MAG: UxaA family hydrolase [Bilophila wadsworthia]